MDSTTVQEHVSYAHAAMITGLPVGTLYAMVSRKQIPHVRLGRRLVRFSRKELESWIERHRVEPSNKTCEAKGS